MAEDNINYLTCKNCGAQLSKTDEDSTTCPYCGSIGFIDSPINGSQEAIKIDVTYHPILPLEKARAMLNRKIIDYPFHITNPGFLNFKIKPRYIPFWHIFAQCRYQWQGPKNVSYHQNGMEDAELIFAVPASSGINVGQINQLIEGHEGSEESVGLSPHDKTWEIIPAKVSVEEALKGEGILNYINNQGLEYCRKKRDYIASVVTSIVSYQSKCKYMPICIFEYEANGQRYKNLVNLFNGSVTGDFPVDNSTLIAYMKNVYQRGAAKNKGKFGQCLAGLLMLIALGLSIWQFIKGHYLLGSILVFVSFVLLVVCSALSSEINTWMESLSKHKESIARFILSQNSHAMKKLTSIYGESFAKSIHQYVARFANENRLGEIDIPIVNAIAHAELDLKDVADKFWQDLRPQINIPDRF